MVRQGWKNPKAWSDDRGGWQDGPRQDGSRKSWSYWSGSWKASPKSRAKGQGNYQFPAYDDEQKDAQGLVAIAEQRTPQPGASSGPSLVQLVQAAVNQARKLDGKLHKLQSDLEAKERQWQAYTLAMRKSYQQEKQRHAEAVQRLQDEIAEVFVLQRAAHDHIKPVAAASKALKDSGKDTAAVEFMALVGETGAADRPSPLLSSELVQMLTMVQQQMATNPSSPGPGLSASQPAPPPVPTTPPHRGTHVPPMTPESASAASRTSASLLAAFDPLRDPYMASPSTMSAPPPGETTAPGAAFGSATELEFASRARPKLPDGKTRHSVKHVSQQVVHGPSTSPSLSDKLQAVREAELAKRAVESLQGSGDGTASEPNGESPRFVNLINDDDEEMEELESPLSSRSPGLGKLE